MHVKHIVDLSFMFQSQYSFIHLVLLEHITCGVTSIAAPIDNVEEIEEIINELSSVNPKTNKTGFQQQFEVSQLCAVVFLVTG